MKGGISLLFVILLLLLAAAGLAVDYRMSIPGNSLVERMRAKPVVMDMDMLTGQETQAEIRQSHRQLKHTCTPETNPLGDHVCWAAVSEFNGIDARIIAFFFRDNRLSAVRVSFAAEHQPAMFALMEKRYGEARPFGRRLDVSGNKVVGWIRPSGYVATNDQLSGDDEALLLWLSPDTVRVRRTRLN